MSRNLFRINNGILTIANGSEEVANFDFEGRLLFYTRSGVLHRRSTDNNFYRLGWEGDIRQVVRLDPAEVENIVRRCYDLSKAFPSETLKPEENEILSRIASRDYGWLVNDSNSMLSHYSSMPVMPPDQSTAIYLELTSGCNWNRCTICKSYGGRSSEQKSSDDFMKHVEDVVATLGHGVSSKKGIFLGDSGALDVDQKALIPILDNLKAKFGLPIFAAFDIFSTPKRKNMIHYQDLKKHGLERIFVFIESGSYKIIKLFNQKINVTETLNIINNIKDHGIAVSIVVLVGMGGKKYSTEHVEGTSNIISQMNLESGDMIFLSPVVESDDEFYLDIAQKEGLGVLTPAEKLAQATELERAIRESYLDMNGTDLAIPIVKYDLREALF